MSAVKPINFDALDFASVGALVGAHLDAASVAPMHAVPPPVAASPVDVAATGAATAMRTKMAAMQGELAEKGPEMQGKSATSASALQEQDAQNASPLKNLASAIPSGGSSSGGGSSGGGSKSGIHEVDNRTFKEAPNPMPEPPPGGWSSDPLMRAAQKIAYGHASGPKGHMGQFSGMTKDQLADLIHDMFTRDPKDLVVGRTADGAPALYDPKTNTLVIRDPNGLDCGTVFKPDRGAQYVLGDENGPGKIAVRQPSLQPGDLADKAPPDISVRPEPVEPGPPNEASSTPSEAAPGRGAKPSPKGGIGAGPSTPIGPHFINPHHSTPHIQGDWDSDPEAIP